jgi:hypothetical protein
MYNVPEISKASIFIWKKIDFHHFSKIFFEKRWCTVDTTFDKNLNGFFPVNIFELPSDNQIAFKPIS